ncbi:MAG: PspC domain-containing protein [Chloroflexaceae bacterium]|jgi:phage shock protein PspC (stress-responsive transcriptional regulator)|nr:PspC domain-containing protein [Chloroflexaceae bacterium]
MEPTRVLRRPSGGRVLGGVCAAFGRYFGLDPTLIRVGWALLVLLAGTGGLAYLLAWFIIPDEHGKRDTAPLIVFLVFFVLLPLLSCLLLTPFSYRWL